MTDWPYQFVLSKNGTKTLTTVYHVVSDSMLNHQEGFIVQEGTHIPVGRLGQEGELHIWQESTALSQDGHPCSLEISDLFSSTTSVSDVWRYHAQLRGTTFEASSRYSEDDAIKNVCERMIAALDGSYDPLLLTFRGRVCVVWRDPNRRWGCTSIPSGTDDIHALEACISGCSSRADALRHARILLAWQTWDGEEETCSLLIEPADQYRFTQRVHQRKQERKPKATGPDPATTLDGSHPKPCQHLNATLTLTEETYHEYTFSDGKIYYVDDDIEPDLTHALTFRCPDCGEEDGWSDYQNAPSEIKALYQKILEQDYSSLLPQNEQEMHLLGEDSQYQINTEREIEPGR